MRHLSITPIKCTTVTRGAKTATVLKAMKKDDIDGKWALTSWAKKLNKAATRGSLSDFDRFKVMILRKQVYFNVFCVFVFLGEPNRPD